MGCSEEDFGAGGSLDLLVGVELGAVVEREGVSGAGSVVDEVDDAAVELGSGASAELAEEEVAGPAIDEGNDAMAA